MNLVTIISMALQKLGKLLIEHNVLTVQQVNKALQAQKLYGGKLGTNLVELGFITDEELSGFLAKQLNMETASKSDFDHIDHKLLSLISPEEASFLKLIPVRLTNRLYVAVSGPIDADIIDSIGFKIGHSIRMLIAPEIWIIAALERYYGLERETRYVNVLETDESFVVEPVNLSGAVDRINQPPMEKDGVDKGFENESLIPPTEAEETEQAPLQRYSEQLLSAISPQEVFRVLFSFLVPIFSQMAIFSIREEKVSGLVLHGFPVRLREFTQLTVPLLEFSVAKTMVDQQNKLTPHLIKSDQVHEKIVQALSFSRQQMIGLYPICFQTRVVAILLGVPDSNRPVPVPNAGLIVVEVARKAGLALEALFLRKKIGGSTTESR